MINNNYMGYNPQQNNVSYGAVKDVVPNSVNEKLPENLQNLDAKQIASNNGAIAAAGGMDKATLLATLPFYTSFLVLRNLNDKIGSKFSFSGEYSDSFLGKLTKLGDRVSGVISKIIPDNIENGIKKGAKNAKTWLQNHSAFARSMSTPLRLENSMAMTEATGLYSRVLYDNGDLIQKGFRGRGKEALELFKNGSNGKFWDLLKTKGVESATDDGEILSKISDTFRDLAQKPPKDPKVKECVDDVIEIFSKTDKKAVIDKWGPLPIGKIPFLNKLLKLEVPLSEAANKTKVATGAVGATTALGKAFPSAFSKVYEGFTNNFAGGKIAPLMQAYFLATAAIKAKQAPEGQKLATFMDEQAMGVATLFTMPLATSALTKLGGAAKYIGMGKTVAEQTQNVDKYRNLIKSLNEKVDAKSITRAEYLDEVKNIKNVLKGETKWWQKPIKFIGKILGSNYNAETIKPYIDDAIPTDMGKLQGLGLGVSNKVKNFAYKLKSGKYMGITPGGMLRFALVMFVLSPIVSKPIKWAVNKIFGKPWDPEKEKQEQEKKMAEEAMKNNPFAKITEEELMNLLTKNQARMMQAQNDPKLMQELQSDPNKLYNFLKEGADIYDKKLQNAGPSPLLNSYINSRNAGQQPIQPTSQVQTQQINPSSNLYTPNNQGFNMNQTLNLNSNNQKMPAPSVQTTENKEESKPIEPTRTYIPSSKPADFSAQQNAKNQQFEQLLADIDRTEKEYSQYLSI